MKRNRIRMRTYKMAYPHFIIIQSKTHSLCGATQGHFPPPRLIPLAARTEPGLCLIDSTGTSLLLAETRGGKVRDWVAGAMVCMETNGLEIIVRWPGEGELNGIVWPSKGTGSKTRST